VSCLSVLRTRLRHWMRRTRNLFGCSCQASEVLQAQNQKQLRMRRRGLHHRSCAGVPVMLQVRRVTVDMDLSQRFIASTDSPTVADTDASPVSQAVERAAGALKSLIS